MRCFYLLSLLFITSCQAQTNEANSLNADAFEKAIAAVPAQILDVRTWGEYNSGHIKNALWADWRDHEQFKYRIQFVDKNKPVYIYCLSGGRSAAAADWMRNNGFQKVIELKGGIHSWQMANKPVEGASQQPQINLEEFKNQISSNGFTLVDFGADWCPPCVKMQPVIQDLLKEKASVKFIRIDAGTQTELMKQMNITGIPIFIIYKNGTETWRKQGVVEKSELLAHLNE
jgi:rhodanese-related sulfurtransferase